MSFFTGKPSGRGICHVSKGHHNRTTMAGAPFSDTVFHTDIKYTGFTVYNYTSKETVTSSGYSGSSTVNEFKFSTAAYDLLGAGYAYALINTATGKIFFPGIYNYWSYKLYYLNGSEVDLFYVMSEPSTIHHKTNGSIWNGTGYTTIERRIDRVVYSDLNITPRLVIFSFKFNGSITYPTKVGDDVRIDNSQFSVAGINILTQRYLSDVKINPIDHFTAFPLATSWSLVNYSDPDPAKTARWTGNVQFINSFAPGVGCEIISNPTKTEIKAGGKVIITSIYGAQKVQMGRIQYIPSANWYLDGSGNNAAYGPIGGPFYEGDLVYMALRINFLDTNQNPHIHDVQRMIRWGPSSDGEIEIPIEIRLYAWFTIKCRSNYLYVSFDQIVSSGYISGASCTTMLLK